MAVNLLPRDIAVRQREVRLFQASIAGGGVIVLLLVLLTIVYRGREAHERNVLNDEQQKTGVVRAEVARLQVFAQLEQQVLIRRATLASALTTDVAWSKLLNDVSLIMPENAFLNSLSLTAAPGTAANGTPAFGSVAFSGLVTDFPGLAGWLTRMSQIEGLTFLYLGSGSRGTTAPTVTFAANASLNQTLLSRRCQSGQRCP